MGSGEFASAHGRPHSSRGTHGAVWLIVCTHIAQTMMDALTSPSASAVHLTGVVSSRGQARQSGTKWFICPDLISLFEGLRDEVDLAEHCHGWQFFTAHSVESHFRVGTVWPRLVRTEQAHLKAQLGPHGQCFVLCNPFFAAHSPCAATLPRAPVFGSPPSHLSHLHRRPLDLRGHHRAACLRGSWAVGDPPWRAAAARVCGFGLACRPPTIFVGWRWSRMVYLFWVRPVGHRHHSGVPRACRRRTPWSVRPSGRGSHRRSSRSEAPNLP